MSLKKQCNSRGMKGNTSFKGLGCCTTAYVKKHLTTCWYSQTSLFRHSIIRNTHFLTQMYVKPINMDHFVLDLVPFVRQSDADYDTKISLANPTYACAMSYLHCTYHTHGCQAKMRGSLWRAEVPNLYLQARKSEVYPRNDCQAFQVKVGRVSREANNQRSLEIKEEMVGNIKGD